jgi:pimeloyl-ACP methyl ester carboxylesterase
MILIIMLCLSCAQQSDNSTAKSRVSYFVKIQSDISLEIVDWGGKGKPLVFLAGLGHTVHAFDEFAPRLTDDFKVIGITRRGFGSSAQPESGYDIDTLANDIRIVLDSLQLKDVVLIGHSLGGDEMTTLAALNPSGIDALVYLDAAYAQVTLRDTLNNYPLPDIQYPEPTTEDLQSPESYQLFYEKINGIRMPLSEIKEMYNWNDDSSFSGGRTPGWIYSQISSSLYDQDYTNIVLPALAVYGVDYPIEELFLDFQKADTADQALMMAYYLAGKKMAAFSRKRFIDHMRNGEIVELIGAGHSIYITHPEHVEKAIRSFIDNLQ